MPSFQFLLLGRSPSCCIVCVSQYPCQNKGRTVRCYGYGPWEWDPNEKQIQKYSVVLGHQLRRNVLAYLDGIVVTSSVRINHVADLAETFTSLRKMNLSQKNASSEFTEKVLGCLISTKWMEAHIDKVKAFRNMEEPNSIKDVQMLTGRIAALNRFIPRLAD